MTIARNVEIAGVLQKISITLSDEELEKAYREQERLYRMEDIRDHLNNMEKNELFGYTAKEVADDSALMERIFQRFVDFQDCNLPENDVMDDAIRSVLSGG